jgi:hypothetical protein
MLFYIDVLPVFRVEGGTNIETSEEQMFKGVFGSKKGQVTETGENYVINSFTMCTFQ